MTREGPKEPVTVRLPPSVSARLREMAQMQSTTVSALVQSAISDKLATLDGSADDASDVMKQVVTTDEIGFVVSIAERMDGKISLGFLIEIIERLRGLRAVGRP